MTDAGWREKGKNAACKTAIKVLGMLGFYALVLHKLSGICHYENEPWHDAKARRWGIGSMTNKDVWDNKKETI